MTPQLPYFGCFFAAGSWEKDIENGAAVMSLRSFLFHDDFNFVHLTELFTTGITILFNQWAISLPFWSANN